MPNVDTTANVHPALAPGLWALDFSRMLTMKLAEGLTEDQLFTRACPGANHGAWVLGHIAHTDDVFLTAMGGKTRVVPESWDALFGMNSEVSDDRSKHPGKDELIAALQDRRAALKAWLGSLSEGELLAPIEGDFAMFGNTRAAVAATLAYHEGFHAGQLSTGRRAAGLAPMF